jgi:transposase-like protein
MGAAPASAMVRPRAIENPEVALRERAVLAMLRGDEAPRSVAMRFGLPLEEIFYWLDVYREGGRRALSG